MGKVFKTATAFRKSLESRLMNISQETNIDLQRLRRKVALVTKLNLKSLKNQA